MKKGLDLTNAPRTKDSVLSPDELVSRLEKLVGTPMVLKRKPRTDGANIRKLVSKELEDRISNALDDSRYQILPPKGKGVPRLLLELIDTYVVTSGDTYNLQVWNRIPNGNTPLVRYYNGDTITAQDIRFVFVKVTPENEYIESIVILTPQYIEEHFGSFGKPTIKQQLLVSNILRQKIVNELGGLYFAEDTLDMKHNVSDIYKMPSSNSDEFPHEGDLLSLEIIKEKVAKPLIGQLLDAPDTKTRGQLLEKKVIELLGYGEYSKLVGGYPDVPNQLLEVKIQDTQTIDLGKYSPQFIEKFEKDINLSTGDVRYLIALTNADTKCIDGIILCPGKELGVAFTYVSDKSYKCQRSINMTFFDNYIGHCVFNPED